MKNIINCILIAITVIVYIGVIIMKFCTPIDIPNGSFIIITLVFIIAEGQFINMIMR